MPEIPLDKLFVLLFMMTGPLRVVPGFAAITQELDAEQRGVVATRGALYASAGVILAVFMGHTILASWGATPESLAAATGLLLFVTALQSLVGWPVASQPTQNSPPLESNRTGPLSFSLSDRPATFCGGCINSVRSLFSRPEQQAHDARTRFGFDIS